MAVATLNGTDGGNGNNIDMHGEGSAVNAIDGGGNSGDVGFSGDTRGGDNALMVVATAVTVATLAVCAETMAETAEAV